ncbi:MAG: hypothetical protein B7C54_12360 [Acidimicrobiales bacterium mtb01]|nr:HNH endonuclease [Actinomycetota bacterium]TEX45822.1 MAG: hypothetical protein B7C54_12360 [Acidimicrobiales bacterium mtb01]
MGLHAIVSTRTIRPATQRAAADDSGPETIAGGPLDDRVAVDHAGRMLSTGRRSVGCCTPGCAVKFAHTEPHHLTPWEHGGPTNLDNLVPLCSRHHHTVHEGGIPIRLDPVTRHVKIQT